MDSKLLTEETKAIVVDFIYDNVKARLSKWLTMFGVAKFAIKTLIEYVNKKGDEFIPDEIDIYINDAITKFKAGETEAAVAAIANAENKLINLPNMDEVQEYGVFYANTYALVSNIKYWITKKPTDVA